MCLVAICSVAAPSLPLPSPTLTHLPRTLPAANGIMGRWFVPIRSKYGLFAVGVLYFTAPVVVGYGIMQVSNWVAAGNRERLLASIEAAKVRPLAATPAAPATSATARAPAPATVGH